MLVMLFFVAIGVVVILGSVSLIAASRAHARRVRHGGEIEQPTPGHPARAVIGAVGLIVGIVVCIFALGFREIGPGSVGVIVNFGRVQGGSLSPGLVWVTPFVSDVVVLNTRVQAYNFGDADENNDGQPDGIEAFTQEQQPAFLFGVVNYHIDPSYAAELYQRVGTDYFEKVIRQQSDAELKQDARAYPVDQITARRDKLAKGALERLTTDVAPFHIVIDGVFISQIGLSKEYLASVEAKQIALQNVEKAKAEANSAREKAKGEADAQVTTANGQAQANKLVNDSLTDALIRWQAIQKLNPNVQVMLVPDSSNFLFNLPGASPAP